MKLKKSSLISLWLTLALVLSPVLCAQLAVNAEPPASSPVKIRKVGDHHIIRIGEDELLATIGDIYINEHVRGDVLTIFGDVELGPDAVVDGDIACLGGHVHQDPAAQVKGELTALGGEFDFGGLAAWLKRCLGQGRLLAFEPGVLWAWAVAMVFLVGYIFIAWLVPDSVRQCVQTLETYPGKSILAAALALVLTPLAYALLAVTVLIVVGLLLIPVFSVGLFCIGLFGKLVMLAWLGRRLTKADPTSSFAHPALSVLLGGLVVMGLYCVPWVGLLIYKSLDILGVGVVIYTLVLAANARKTPTPAAPLSAAAWSAENPAGAMPPPMSSPLPPVISAATLPRAGFWLRFAATGLDIILIGILSVFLTWLGGGFPLWLVLYSVAMWATKGTTIGGVICGLKVVRVDDRPMDWGVAVVRALGAFLSLAVAGLGFIWVALDDDRQSWHDKIAGTTIVRVPKGTALL